MKLYCLFLCLCFSLAASSQEMIDTAVLGRIRTEELAHTQGLNGAGFEGWGLFGRGWELE